MATDPIFAATPFHYAVLTPATLDTSLTAPTNVATLVPSQANGFRLDQIRFIQVASTAASGIVNLFTFDGTNYRLLDWLSFNLTTLSTTAEASPLDYFYNISFPTNHTLVVTTTVAAGQSAFAVHAWGGAI